MITFDSLTLKALISEQKDFLEGSRITKIQQPTRRELIFALRNNGETRQFYVNIYPQMCHVCFMSKKNYETRHIDIPQKPPMFCMLLRKYLSNSRIAKINQPEYERILEFYIETYNEIGDKIYLCLAFELMGKHSNVVLYNHDTSVILGCAHNVGSEKSREREMYGGIPYIYPPKQLKTDILNYNGEVNYETLSEVFYWFSKYFAAQCKGKTLEDLKRYVCLTDLSPCLSNDFNGYSLFSELADNGIKYSSVNDVVDGYYAYQISLDKFKALRNQYRTVIDKKIKKVKKTLNQMEYKMNQNSNINEYRLYGDLIMANLYNLADYSSEASVYDYENDKQIKILLDNTKTLKENANNFYKQYNKIKTSNAKLSELIAESKQLKENLDSISYSIELAETLEDLYALSDEIEETKEHAKVLQKSSEPLKLDVGHETWIYIGRNNKQNNFIVSKLASDEDLWFHAKDCTGSHVLLKTQNVTNDLILKCAKYAKEYSRAKDSTKIGVIYTKCRYLRKPPKAALGYVTYKNEKEIVVE